MGNVGRKTNPSIFLLAATPPHVWYVIFIVTGMQPLIQTVFIKCFEKHYIRGLGIIISLLLNDILLREFGLHVYQFQ